MKEIILCKDCKGYYVTPIWNLVICKKFGGFVNENDFCSRGEKCENKGEEAKNDRVYTRKTD